MAEPTLNTDLSRRSMLAGTAVAAAAAAAATPVPVLITPAAANGVADAGPAALAAVPVTCPADTNLLREVAAAEAAWTNLSRERERCAAITEATERHPDYSQSMFATEEGHAAFLALAEVTGYTAAWDRYDVLEADFEAARATAFAAPARSLQALHARFRFSLTMLQAIGPFETPCFDWLEKSIADLARLTGTPPS